MDVANACGPGPGLRQCRDRICCGAFVVFFLIGRGQRGWWPRGRHEACDPRGQGREVTCWLVHGFFSDTKSGVQNCVPGHHVETYSRGLFPRGVTGTSGATCSMNSFLTLSWTPGADEHQGRGGWIEGEHGVTKPRQWYRYVSNMCSGSKVQKRRLYLMCGWPLSTHLRDGATSTLRAICGGRPRGESSPRRPQEPQDKSHAPGKEAPQGHKARFTFPRGGEGRRGFAPLGLGYCLL